MLKKTIILVVILAMLGLMLSSLFDYFNTAKYIKIETRVTEFVKYDASHPRSGQATVLFSHALYTTYQIDGQKYLVAQEFFFKPKQQVGDTITIHYDPANPAIIKNNVLNIAIIKLITAGFCLVFVLIASFAKPVTD